MSFDFAASFQRTATNLASLDAAYLETVSAATAMLVDAFARGGQLLTFGNGGSSADAQHIAAELVGRFLKMRRPLSALALTTNQAFMTAWSNDAHYDDVFGRQIEAHGRPGDVAWGISTSGNSANVVIALERARQLGLRTIGLSGRGGGQMAQHCDVLIAVPLTDTPRIQEVHLVTYHVICEAVEAALF